MTSIERPSISIIGGTGQLGHGLALRLARAGYPLIIGSRCGEQAKEFAQRVSRELVQENIQDSVLAGMDNVSAAKSGHCVFVTVPFSAHRQILESINEAVQGKILVDVTVPLVPPRVARVQLPPEGSAGQIAQELLGEEVRVVSAFQNVAAVHLQTQNTIPCDVLVTGNDKAARQFVIDIISSIGMRGFHAGLIHNAAAAEALTSVLINLNKQFKTHAGLQFTGID